MRKAVWIALLSSVVICTAFAWHYLCVPVLVLGPMVQQMSSDGFALFCEVHGGSGIEASVYEDNQLVCTGLVSPQKHGRYIISFSSLNAGQPYEYRLTTGKRELCRHIVRTAPADHRPVRVLAFGDSGTGGWSQNRLASRMAAYHPDLIVHTGDMIYPKGRLEENHRKFFQPYAELLATTPVYPCLGNHEYKMEGVEPVSEAFILPPNGPADVPIGRNYWFDHGQIRFVSMDGNNGGNFYRDVAAPWLDEALGGAGDRCRVVFFHPPVYSHGKYIPEKYEPQREMLAWIVPLLDRHEVELVLCGHNHMYERTRPLRNGQIMPEGQGTIYVTSGAGGANLANAQLPMPDTIAAWNDREHSFTIVDISSDTIGLRQIGKSGRVLDEYHTRRNRPTTAPAEP